MKTLFSILLCIVFCLDTHAQQLEVKEFKLDPTDLRARTRPRKDINGDPCALVKIQIPVLHDLVVESSTQIGTMEYTPGEYMLFLGDGTRNITLKHPDYEPTEIDFGTRVEGMNAYILKLDIPKTNDNTSFVHFHSNVTKFDLEVNNQTHSTENGEVYVRLSPATYHYTISTPLSGFESVSGTFDVAESDINGIKALDRINLPSAKKFNLHISAPEESSIKIDGQPVRKWNKPQLLPAGSHTVEASIGNISRTFNVDMSTSDQLLNADVRGSITVAYPTGIELELTPLAGALKPTKKKFLPGEEIFILGKYKMTAKKKGYEPKTIEIEALSDEDRSSISLDMISNADNYYNGHNGFKLNRDKAVKEYKKLIENGDDQAMLSLAQHYNNGGKWTDPAALSYLTKATHRGNPKANYITAQLEPKPQARIPYLNKAVEGGYRDANLLLGKTHLQLQDTAQAINALLKVRNNAEAALLLGRTYFTSGRYRLARYFFDQVKDHEYYGEMARSYIGDYYFYGIGCNKDPQKAMKLYGSISPENMSAYSRMNIGTYYVLEYNDKLSADRYLSGLPLEGLKTDNTPLADVMRSMGKFFYDKNNEHYSQIKTFRYLLSAYNLGDRSTETCLILGKCYKDGEGVGKDLEQAIALLKPIADEGNLNAMRWLGNAYESKGLKNTAFELYKEASKQGDIASTGFIGTMYADQKNWTEAVKNWEAAAKKGHKNSIKQLIKYYNWRKNSAKASFWKKRL